MSLQIKQTILSLAAYYGHDLTKEQVNIYAEQLSRSLTDSETKRAALLYMDNPDNSFFPRPVSKLITIIKDPLDSGSKAQQIVSTVRKAVLEKGMSWTTGYFWGKHPDDGHDVFYFEGRNAAFWSWHEAAMDYIGAAGVAVVRHLGGWERLCSSFDESPDTVINAQMLRAAEAVIEIHKQGRQDILPELTQQGKDVLRLISIKDIPK